MQRMQALLGKLDPMTPAVLAGQGRYSTGLLCAIDWALSLRPDDRPRALDDWLAVVNGESEVGVTVRMPARDAQTLARPQVPATGTTPLATDTQPTVLADDDGEDETVVAGASGAVETQFEEATVQAPPPVGSATNSPAPTQGSANWKTSRVLIPAAILVTLSAGVAAWTLLGPSDSPGVSPDKGPPIVAAPVTPTPTAAPKAQIVEVADSEIAAQVRAALEEGRVSGAEQRLAELERVSPNHPDLGELHDQLLSAKTRADLVEQLALAKAAFDDGRLLAPINDNALTFYRDAVGLEPHNDIAEEGIDRVAVRVASAARAAIAAKEFNKAQALLSAAAERKLSRPELAQASKALATAQQQALTSATVDTALALSKAGRFDAALEALDRLGPQQQVPPASRARAEIVTTYSSTLLTEIRKTEGAGNFTDALATLERLEALDPENAAISTIRGRIEGRQRAQKAATARADRIKQLLAAADADIAALRLTSPAGRNALERLREISSLDPDNADAQQRITAIVKRYLKLALQRSRSGDYAAALRFVAKAEGIDTRGEQAEIAALKTMFADAQQANEIPPPTPIAEAKPAPAPIPASPPAVVEVPAKKPAIAAPPKPAFTVSAAVFPSDTMNAGSGHFEKKIYRQMAQGIRGGNAVRTVFKAGVDKPSTSAADFWSGTRPNVGGIRRAAKTYEADLVFVASITGDSMFEAQVTVFAVDLLTGKMTSSNVSPDGVTGSVRAMLAAVKNRR
jgi:tetratricopeptide (TPR) repeat protein